MGRTRSQPGSSLFRNVLKIVFRVLWNLSTGLLCGLYGGVSFFLISNLFISSFQVWFTNSPPWSLRISRGHPKMQINLSISASATCLDSLLLMGTAWQNLVKESSIVRIYRFPFGVSGKESKHVADALIERFICISHMFGFFT